MMHERGRGLKQKGLKLLDLLLTFLAFALAYWVKQNWLGTMSGLVGGVNYLLILLTTVGCCAISYDFINIYEADHRPELPALFRRLLKAVLCGSALAVFFFYVFKQDQVSRLLFALFMVFDLGLLLASRVVRSPQAVALEGEHGTSARAGDRQPGASQGFDQLRCSKRKFGLPSGRLSGYRSGPGRPAGFTWRQGDWHPGRF